MSRLHDMLPVNVGALPAVQQDWQHGGSFKSPASTVSDTSFSAAAVSGAPMQQPALNLATSTCRNPLLPDP